MDNSAYALEIASRHLDRVNLSPTRRREATVLELGPGDSLATAMIAKAYGFGKTVLVDVGDFATRDMRPYVNLDRFLASKGFPLVGAAECVDLSDLLTRCNALYLTNGIESLKTLNKNSVDVVFSNAVLEHVKLSEFAELCRELRRVQNPYGGSSHTIDLRDHLASSLNNLRFPHSVWESSLFSSSGFYTNRLRSSHITELLTSVGFSIESSIIDSWPSLPIKRKALAPEFRGLPDDDLRIHTLQIVLR
jgi:hypothetical protein